MWSPSVLTTWRLAATSSMRTSEALSIVSGLEAISINQVYDHLYRLDLIEQILKGDPELKYEGASRDINWETILGSGAAPQVEVVPERETKMEPNSIRLVVRLVDTGGGIHSKVVFRVKRCDPRQSHDASQR
jgi:hypothetical protein